MSQGVYEIPKIEFNALSATTNTTATGAYRGAGRPEATAMLERIMDLAFDVPTVFVNNFAFMHDFGPPMTTPEVEARGPVPIWNEDFEPAVRAHCEALLNRDYASMSSPEIADALLGYFDDSGRAFRLTRKTGSSTPNFRFCRVCSNCFNGSSGQTRNRKKSARIRQGLKSGTRPNF